MKKKSASVVCFSLLLGAAAFAKTDIAVRAGEEPMTISVMGIDWGVGPVPDSEMERYWEELFDVNLEIEWVSYQDYDQKLNTLIAAGSMPDVIQINKIGGSYYYPIFTQAVDNGLFVELSKYLFGAEGIAETNAVMKNWDESFWNQAKYKEGIYILPRCKAEAGQYSGIEVRRDLMKKYGFEDEPETMDELKDWLIGLSNAATEGEGEKIYALDFFNNAGHGFMDERVKGFAIAFTGQSDWKFNEATGEFEYIQFNEKYLDFLDWMKELYDSEVLNPEFALGNPEVSNWKAGRSVAYLCQWYNWNQSADGTANRVFDSGCPDTYEAWCLMPVKGPQGYSICPNQSDIDTCIAISASCEEEKIQKILDIFNGTEEEYPGYEDAIKFGMEGVHYYMLGDGTRDNNSTEELKRKNREGYVGAWNQIFLTADQDQVTNKFKRDGAKRASEENIARAEEIRAFIYKNLAETGMRNEICNLQSETYNNQWNILTDDVDTMATQYVMGYLGKEEWKSFVQGILESPEYQAIQQEFRIAAGK